MIEVRRAKDQDAREIAAIHVRSWQASYQQVLPAEFLESLSIDRHDRAWRERLSQQIVWVAEEAGKVVGWATAGNSRDADATARTAEIWAIYVDPPSWRRGVGQDLWRELKQHMRASGFDEVTLWVLRENSRALAFYDSIGFNVEAGQEKEIQIGSAKVVELKLRRPLAD